MNAALLAQAQTIYRELASGSQDALAQVQNLRARAQAGDHAARLVFNTLSVLHWQPRARESWPNYEAFYAACAQGNPAALRKVHALKASADAGDEAALRSFRMLKAVHRKYQASAWYPGAPRFSGYGMPMQNRVGIEVPGMSGAQPLTFDAVQRILSLISMALQSSPGMPGSDRAALPPAPQDNPMKPTSDLMNMVLGPSTPSPAPAASAMPFGGRSINMNKLQAAIARRRQSGVH